MGFILQDTEEQWSKPELLGQPVSELEAAEIAAAELEARLADPLELETVERSQELPM